MQLPFFPSFMWITSSHCILTCPALSTVMSIPYILKISSVFIFRYYKIHPVNNFMLKIMHFLHQVGIGWVGLTCSMGVSGKWIKALVGFKKSEKSPASENNENVSICFIFPSTQFFCPRNFLPVGQCIDQSSLKLLIVILPVIFLGCCFWIRASSLSTNSFVRRPSQVKCIST